MTDLNPKLHTPNGDSLDVKDFVDTEHLHRNGDSVESEAGNTGEANTASNLGAGAGVFGSKVGVDLRFKSFQVTGGASISPSATEITITAGDFNSNGSVPMTGDFDANGNDVNNVFDLVFSQQADAPASAAGKHKAYALSSSPTILRAKDSAGGEVYLAARKNFARAYRNSTAQNIPQATWTKVQLNGESWDLESTFDNATNFRFQPNVAGYYKVHWNVEFEIFDDDGGSPVHPYFASRYAAAYKSALHKNGVAHSHGSTDGFVGFNLAEPENSIYPESHGSDEVYLNGTTDYIELYAYGYVDPASGWTSHNVRTGAEKTYMTASLMNIK